MRELCDKLTDMNCIVFCMWEKETLFPTVHIQHNFPLKRLQQLARVVTRLDVFELLPWKLLKSFMQLLHLGIIQKELSPAALVYYVSAPRIWDHKSSKKAKCRRIQNSRRSPSLCSRKPPWPVLSANVPQVAFKTPGILTVDDNRPTNVILHL